MKGVEIFKKYPKRGERSFWMSLIRKRAVETLKLPKKGGKRKKLTYLISCLISVHVNTMSG